MKNISLNRTKKSFPIYRITSQNKFVNKQVKNVNIIGLFNHINLPNTKQPTNRFIGSLPCYVGIQPSVILNNKSILKEYISKNFTDFKNIFGEDVKHFKNSINEFRVNVSGSYDSSVVHLREYMKNDSTELTCEEILTTVLERDRNGWFNSPIISMPSNEDIINLTKINIHSKSGLYTGKMCGDKKGETLLYTIPAAVQLYNGVKERYMKNEYLWSIAGREKDNKLKFDNEFKELSSRLVLYTEAPASILLCNIAQRIQHSINKDESGKYKFHAEGKFDGSKIRKIESKRLEYQFELEADWVFYDSNIDGEYIKAGALMLLSGMYDGSDESKKLIYYIYKSIRTKNVVVPNKLVIEVNRAVPSGHPFTTLINNYVNLIYWCQIGYKIYGMYYQDYMHVETYGDDANVFFKYSKKLFYIDTYVKELGLKSENLANKLKVIKNHDDNNIDFLKRFYNSYQLKWNYKKMFDKLFYQSKNRGVLEQCEQLFSYLVTTPDDRKLKELTINFLGYVIQGDEFDSLGKIDKEKIYNLLLLSNSVEEFVKDYSIISDFNILNFEFYERIYNYCKTMEFVNVYDTELSFTKERIVKIIGLHILSTNRYNVNSRKKSIYNKFKIIKVFNDKIYSAFNVIDQNKMKEYYLRL